MLDASLIIDYFRLNGWKTTTQIPSADLIVLGTCGFSSSMEDVTKGFISKANRRKRKGAKLVLIGCLPGINQSVAHDFQAIAISRNSYDKLDALIDSSIAFSKLPQSLDLANYQEDLQKSFTLADRAQAKLSFSLEFLFRSRKPHPTGVVMWDWLCRSRMGMAEEAAHCYPYIELMPQHR